MYLKNMKLMGKKLPLEIIHYVFHSDIYIWKVLVADILDSLLYR